MIHLAGTKKVIGMPKNVALGILTKYYFNYLWKFKTLPELRCVLWKCCTWESIWEYLRLTRHVGCSPNAGVSKFVLDVSEKSGKLVSGECLQFYYKPYQWNQWVIKWISVVCDNDDIIWLKKKWVNSNHNYPLKCSCSVCVSLLESIRIAKLR